MPRRPAAPVLSARSQAHATVRTQVQARERAPRHRQHDGDRGREPHAQARPHLRDAEEPREEGREHLRRRHARGAARRLRLPALAGHVLPRGHRRHLHLAVADPPLQPAHRRHDRGRDPHAEGRRALLRAGEGGQGQRRAAGEREEQDPVREPDAALPRRAARRSSATSRPRRTSPAASSTSSRRSARASAACWCPRRSPARR